MDAPDENEIPGDGDEILRLRNRLHKMQKELVALAYRLQAMEALKPAIDEAVLAQRVAAGVKQAIDEDSTIGLKRWQKIGIAAGILSGLGVFALEAIKTVF